MIQRFALVLPALVAVACGGGNGDRTTPTDLNTPPSIANQQPIITGAQVPNDTKLPGSSQQPSGGSGGGGGPCESFCNRALAADCTLNGDTDCASACAELKAQECATELLALANCALSVNVCPDDFEGNATTLAASCQAQALAYGTCLDLNDSGNK